MSLVNGSLQIGQSAIRASQAALQVIGNNVANAASEDYTRRRPSLEPTVQTGAAGRLQLGTGVQLAGVQRLVDEAINARLRSATSDQASAQSAADAMAQIETVFNPLGDENISTQLTALFNAFGDLANDPQSAARRSLLLQAGNAVAQSIATANSTLGAQRTQVNNQLTAMVEQANRLISQVADLNGQITMTESGTDNGAAAGLRDQRDAALRQLSELMNVQTQAGPNGAVNVYLNSTPLVMATDSFGLTVAPDPDSTRGDPIVRFDGSNMTASITGGQIGGLLAARTDGIDFAQDRLDILAVTLINEVNRIHSQGQGLTGLESITSTNAVADTNAALNSAGLDLAPVNGTFEIHVTDPDGQQTTYTIAVNLAGVGSDDSLSTLAGKIDGLSSITATAQPDGRLAIAAERGYSFTFSDDTSGALAGLGINTFFTGHNAADIAVRGDLTPSGIAAATNGLPADSGNALRLAGLVDQKVGSLDGLTLSDYFTQVMGTLASRAAKAGSDSDAASAVADALASQRDAISGVSTDEEAIDLMKYQRAYQGAAHYISLVNQLLDELMRLV